VNPAHLEAVTPRTNVHRATGTNALKTHCLDGHLLDGANLIIKFYPARHERACRICKRRRDAERRTRKKETR
jgi:hypothetical protein